MEHWMPHDRADLDDTETQNPATLVWQRYRDGTGHPPAPWNPAAWNDVIEQLFQHRSVRSYLRDPLPEGTLELLVGAAQSAASSSNLQTWSVVAVEQPERKAQLAELAARQKHIEQAPLFLVWLADLARLDDIASARGVEVEGTRYLELFLVAIIDAALAAQNAVIAAESLGLGTVYIGAIRNNIPAVARLLGLPPQVMPVFGMTIGYPDPERRTDIKPRLSQNVVLHRERYSSAGLADGVDHYQAAMSLFQAAQGLPAEDWAAKVIDRVRTAASLSGRHRLVEILHDLGFGLR
jgi:nitroreductase